eukprot:356145-Chlamydomonas_euryale.AAC.3
MVDMSGMQAFTRDMRDCTPAPHFVPYHAVPQVTQIIPLRAMGPAGLPALQVGSGARCRHQHRGAVLETASLAVDSATTLPSAASPKVPIYNHNAFTRRTLRTSSGLQLLGRERRERSGREREAGERDAEYLLSPSHFSLFPAALGHRLRILDPYQAPSRAATKRLEHSQTRPSAAVGGPAVSQVTAFTTTPPISSCAFFGIVRPLPLCRSPAQRPADLRSGVGATHERPGGAARRARAHPCGGGNTLNYERAPPNPPLSHHPRLWRRARPVILTARRSWPCSAGRPRKGIFARRSRYAPPDDIALCLRRCGTWPSTGRAWPDDGSYGVPSGCGSWLVRQPTPPRLRPRNLRHHRRRPPAQLASRAGSRAAVRPGG